MDTQEILGLPIALPDGVNYDDYVIATYLVSYPAVLPVPMVAPLLAVEQSTGTWIAVPGETPEVRCHHIAKVIGVYEMPDYEAMLPPNLQDRQWFVQIAYPEVNIGEQIPMLLTTVVGNISMGGDIKVLDIRLPKKYVNGFKGPKFGIEGVRKLLGVYNRPLLNNMIKPCTGYGLELGAELFRKAALGGCDIVKDDELIADASFNSALGRVKRYIEIEKQVYEETGEHTLYTVNITDNIPKVFKNAKKAVELGANAIMINYLAVGFPVMQALAEDKSINVPILAHMDVAGALYMSPYHGMSSHLVLGKLPRLAGADVVVIPAPYGKAPVIDYKFKNAARNLSFPLYNLKPTFPMASGGITPSMVPQVMADLGNDIVIGSGGGIHAHPQGPIAGGKAFRHAINATMKGIPVAEYAKDHEELDLALKIWADPFSKGIRL
ncbi:MAG: ribulose 1,5-bisphosphate carboxylase [Chloroflexi bacterium]|nr:ribulose 1,5-bisphosphate carboxylase [Chloroflexota bacterium]MBM3154737.1 ribulose 1,5-bisphosphate carboxylase [Chloroflexota bacterium]MBM3172753.1 ribulose 1,5-bisphosphate carboxylase [Chloroflexota bacterium]MBM3174738.1 ribulose 1,5-bisphosphate carboxylase [Chloroflexota bacterium]MBM4450005.1 ribulose 1,5-bisphosphate carboxylase [Chloroflexota bacterium]